MTFHEQMKHLVRKEYGLPFRWTREPMERWDGRTALSTSSMSALPLQSRRSYAEWHWLQLRYGGWAERWTNEGRSMHEQRHLWATLIRLVPTRSRVGSRIGYRAAGHDDASQLKWQRDDWVEDEIENFCEQPQQCAPSSILSTNGAPSNVKTPKRAHQKRDATSFRKRFQHAVPAVLSACIR